MTRDELLNLDDDALLRLCRIDRCRGSGHGGQKRNVTDSAVRLTHPESGISGASDETRSQIHNRTIALRHLRHHLAIEWRCPAPPATPLPLPAPNRQRPEYALWLAHFLDLLEAAGYAMRDAADRSGLGTGKMVKLLANDPAAWEWVNRQREKRGLTRLRQG